VTGSMSTRVRHTVSLDTLTVTGVMGGAVLE
jgi:hypothetical protein